MGLPVKKFVAFSCSHFSKHDKGAHDWVLRTICDEQPDVVIHLGDLLEASGASRWENEDEGTLLDEYNMANDFLRDCREAQGNTGKYIWMFGNHDANILAANRIPQKLRGCCDFRLHMQEIVRGQWGWFPYRFNVNQSVYRIGQVSFFHGFKSGVSADREHCALLGDDYGLTVSGHTHRPCHVTQLDLTKSIPLNRWYTNVGTLCNIESMDYVERQNTVKWGQGLLVGEAADLKSPRRGRYWDAELRLRHMAWDTKECKSWKTALEG